jgi:hypothetical protein
MTNIESQFVLLVRSLGPIQFLGSVLFILIEIRAQIQYSWYIWLSYSI